MIYYVLEHNPKVEWSDSFDEFVDFEDLSLEQVKALLSTQEPPNDHGGERKILATMPEIHWHITESRTRPWTDYVSLEFFFPWPEGQTGQPTPLPLFDQPIAERFVSVDRELLERLADAYEPHQHARLLGMLEAFRAAIDTFKPKDD